MTEIQKLCEEFVKTDRIEELTEIIEGVLGPGKKVSECTKKQLSAVIIIRDEIKQALGN